MPTITLVDASRDIWVDTWSMKADSRGHDGSLWSIHKRVLRGGRRDGVEIVEVDNGALSFVVVPSRGMGLWRGSYAGLRLGWDAPIIDGPVHPKFISSLERGGIGWLEGFDEWMVRCGLESNGPPCSDEGRTHTLHGRIANTPAWYLAVEIDENPPHALTVTGMVDEASLFGSRLRLYSKVITTPGSNRLTVIDEVENLGDVASGVQLLYHWNFGPPFLGPGSRFVSAARFVCPRDAEASVDIENFDVFAPPTPGKPEQVYYFGFHQGLPDSERRAVAMLCDELGERGVALRFSSDELPAFTLWKNCGGVNDGYVTGLEPATNYPNARPFERAQGRVVPLSPRARLRAETTLEVLAEKDGVRRVEAEVAEIAASRGGPTVHSRPIEPFAPESGTS